MGHGETLYDEQVRIPFLVAYPARIRPGQRVDRPVSLLDIFPTILELAGERSSGKMEGESLLPFLDLKGVERKPQHGSPRDLFASSGRRASSGRGNSIAGRSGRNATS